MHVVGLNLTQPPFLVYISSYYGWILSSIPAWENNFSVVEQPNIVERATCRVRRTCPFCCCCDCLGLGVQWCGLGAGAPALQSAKPEIGAHPAHTPKAAAQCTSSFSKPQAAASATNAGGSAFGHDEIPIRPEIALPRIPPVPGSGGAAFHRPGDFSRSACFEALFPSFALRDQDELLGGMDLRTTAAHLRNHDMTTLRPSHVPE